MQFRKKVLLSLLLSICGFSIANATSINKNFTLSEDPKHGTDVSTCKKIVSPEEKLTSQNPEESTRKSQTKCAALEKVDNIWNIKIIAWNEKEDTYTKAEATYNEKFSVWNGLIDKYRAGNPVIKEINVAWADVVDVGLAKQSAEKAKISAWEDVISGLKIKIAAYEINVQKEKLKNLFFSIRNNVKNLFKN